MASQKASMTRRTPSVAGRMIAVLPAGLALDGSVPQLVDGLTPILLGTAAPRATAAAATLGILCGRCAAKAALGAAASLAATKQSALSGSSQVRLPTAVLALRGLASYLRAALLSALWIVQPGTCWPSRSYPTLAA